MNKDYYKTLGIPHTATLAEIKAAFRRLARTYHPDVNPNDPQAARKIQAIIEAYQVLGDPDKRASYDRQCGYDRVASRPTARSFTASTPPYTGSSTPRQRPSHPLTAQAAQELERFVVRQIKKGADRNDMIYEVCLMGNLLWSEAAAFVARVAAKQSPRDYKRLRRIYLAMIAMAVIGAVILGGLLLSSVGRAWIKAFDPVTRELAGIVIVMTVLIILGVLNDYRK